MAIYKNYSIKKAREVGRKLKRPGICEEVIKNIESWDGSYKGAMQLCGQLLFWADASTCDDYWQEQVQKGLSSSEDRASQLLEQSQ